MIHCTLDPVNREWEDYIVYHTRDYLGPRGLAAAFKSFVRPVCEYRCVAIMDASATYLSKLDTI